MRIELVHIHKTFGKVHANDNISLDIPAGTIQGLLGENGAGKSTLMKVLSGFISADSGEIRLDGRLAQIASPADAIRQGIGMLHQDPLDFPPLTALDNFLLGRPGGWFPDRKSARQAFLNLAQQFDFSLDPNTYVDRLTVGERQQLEILRLLWLGARALILDEPTTGISLPQKEKLFATLRKLASQGMTILFVSHKLEDVEALCGQVSVLRQGQLVDTMKPPFDQERLVASMFGKPVSASGRTVPQLGPTLLQAHNLSLEDSRLQVRHLNLEIRAGEVIGLAGMEGSGQTLLLQACAGLLRPVGGRLMYMGRDLTGQTHHAFKKHGAAYLPASRMEEGLVPGLTLAEHFTLAEPASGALIDPVQMQTRAQERIAAFNIKGRPESTVESLSGGNQQRALLALLQSPLNLILLEHPTRGLDIESTAYIWAKLKERCAQGSAVMFISADLDEILQYSDRALVFFAGRVSPPLHTASSSVTQLGQLIGGKGWEALAGEEVHV